MKDHHYKRSDVIRKNLLHFLSITTAIEIFRWCTRKPSKTTAHVPIPPLKSDEWHCMTVLPYLMEHYYEENTNQELEHVEYITEHELNGIIYVTFLNCYIIESFSRRKT